MYNQSMQTPKAPTETDKFLDLAKKLVRLPQKEVDKIKKESPKPEPKKRK
jgi:hypothetical protein